MSDGAETGSEPDGPPAWLPVAGEETVQWQGGPRVQTVIPALVVGVLAVLVGLGTGWVWLNAAGSTTLVLPALAALTVLSGVAIPIWALLGVRYTAYVVTDRHLYRKSGVLGRRVTTVGYETVQNVAYSQGITGRLFDHGTVAFDTAGGSGTELAFNNVDDPREVQRIVGHQRARFGGGDGFGGRPETRAARSIPGTTEQWAAVRDEVVALRRAIEHRT